MKNFIKYISLALAAAVVLVSCKKEVEPLPYYETGADITAQASATTVKPTATDVSNSVLTISWSDPKFATDTANYKYVVEFAPTGSNFANPVAYTVMTKRSIAFTGTDINNILAGLGVPVSTTKDLEVRVKGSYTNNNDMKISNVMKISATSFGVPITLTPTSTNPIVLDVKNATSKAVGFSWTTSPYGANTIYYALQVAVAGTNFANPQTIKYDGALNSGTGITVNDLNNLAIAAGVTGGSTKNLDFRIAAYTGTTYTNFLVYSNTVTLGVTTFTPVPAALYIVGDATPGGWSNPVPLPSQQFTRIDDVSYGITIRLDGGKHYLLLPVNGNWNPKYAVSSDAANPMGDAFGYFSNASPTIYTKDIPSPVTSGLYDIVVNFQTGKYTVTPSSVIVPTDLFMVGSATQGGWTNPVPVSSQQFTRVDAVTYGIIADLNGGGKYLMLTENGKWDPKYAVSSDAANPMGDIFGYYSSASPATKSIYTKDIPAPVANGKYQILANFQTNRYSVTSYTGVYPVPQELFIIGDATLGGWTNPVPLPSQQFSRLNLTQFRIIVDMKAGGNYLLLPNNGVWNQKYAVSIDGANPMSGNFGYYSDDNKTIYTKNIPGPAADGKYLIMVDFATGKYTLTKQE